MSASHPSSDYFFVQKKRSVVDFGMSVITHGTLDQEINLDGKQSKDDGTQLCPRPMSTKN